MSLFALDVDAALAERDVQPTVVHHIGLAVDRDAILGRHRCQRTADNYLSLDWNAPRMLRRSDGTYVEVTS